MHFHTEHRFNGVPEAVAEILSNPDFYLELDLPDLSRPTLVDQQSSRGEAVLRLRYEFTGSLDPIAMRLLGKDRLVWVQEVRVDLAERSGTLSFGAEKDPKRLHGTATFVLLAVDGQTVRRLDGELVVSVPGIGGMAERRIVPGLVRRLDIEAAALDSRLSAQPP